MIHTKGRASEISIDATVTRADGTVEPLGRIALWHRNPIRRIAGRIAIAARRHVADRVRRVLTIIGRRAWRWRIQPGWRALRRALRT